MGHMGTARTSIIGSPTFLGFACVLTAVFAVLEFTHVIHWSWLWVVAPVAFALGSSDKSYADTPAAFGFACVLTAVFVVLELTHVIHWSWPSVASPLVLDVGMILIDANYRPHTRSPSVSIDWTNGVITMSPSSDNKGTGDSKQDS